MNVVDKGSRGIFGAAVRLPLRLIPNGTPVPIFAGPLRGKRWVFGSSTHSCWLGRYELDKQLALSKTIHPGDVFYDLGANVGFYSILASVLAGEKGRVYSFEPSPSNVKRIHQHIQLNKVRNCTVYECAVSDFNGSAKFDFSEELHTMGRLSESDGFEVPVQTLDQIVASGAAEPPNVIKCDIEGAEYRMFCGAQEVIERYKPVIFLATHSPELRSQCHDFLRARKYKMEAIDHQPLDQSDEIIAYVNS